MVATEKPRRRRSAITSKYFSMYSPRPWNRHTVPRRGPRVGAQRAKRRFTPPTPLKVPVMAPLGTGFFARATRSMRLLRQLHFALCSRSKAGGGGCRQTSSGQPLTSVKAKTPALGWGLAVLRPTSRRASIGALPPGPWTVGERAKRATFQRVGTDDLARAAFDGELKQPSARTPRMHNGNIAVERPVMEIMPAIPRQAVANDLARHALPAVTRAPLIVGIGVAMGSRVGRRLLIIAIDTFAGNGCRVGRRRDGEGTLWPAINVCIAGIVVDRSVAVGGRPFIEVGGLRVGARSSRSSEQARRQDPSPHGHSPLGRLSWGKVAATT